jgi:hypothetical protein
MANTTLTADIIAKEAVRVLDNELVMAKKVFRGYEEDYNLKPNGYKVGETITIRKPTDFTVRDGATMNVQDVVEGKTTLTVNKRKGVDFKFTSQDLTLKIEDLSERVIKPAMVQLANQIDSDLHGLYYKVPNWVGTPGQQINSFADFYAGVTRMNEMAVPMDNRCAVMSAPDHGALVGSQTGLFTDTIVKPAYRSGETGMIGGVDLYMTQNVRNHTNGAFAGTVLVDQALTASTTSYAVEKDDMIQTIHIDGLTSATAQLAAGDVFTIADVFDVNPVTKEKKPHLKEFTIVVAPAAAVSNEVDIQIYPALIWNGAFQNVHVTAGVTDLNNKALTFKGTQSVAYPQNMIFHKNAFALVTVPLIAPPGAVDVARRTYNGTSVRVIPVYDGVNDESAWRLDMLYAADVIDPRLASRLSGAA